MPDRSAAKIILELERLVKMTRNQTHTIEIQPTRRECFVFVVKKGFLSGEGRVGNIVVMENKGGSILCKSISDKCIE